MYVFMLAALWGRRIMGPPTRLSQGAQGPVLIAISATVIRKLFDGGRLAYF